MTLISFFNRMLLALHFALLFPAMAYAAVPHESAVPAYAEEQTILQREKDLPEPGFWDFSSGRSHFDRNYLIPPGFMDQQDLILQRGGNTWRELRNGPMATIAGTLLLVIPLLIFGFYHTVGPAPRTVNESGRKIQRFSAWDRVVHWVTAITFIVLAISGLIIMFGKQLLLPWMGHDAFSWVAIISKYAHNFVGPAFILCSIIMFFTFVKENFFRRWDWNWIKKGGGLLSHQHVPAGYFNAGEKIWFWGGVTLLGLLMSITGLLLNFPYLNTIGTNIALSRYVLQVADTLHIIGATLYIIGAMGHIYIGTSGTPGAYEAMRHGTVDESWAKAHHELWYNEVKAGTRTDGRPGYTEPQGPPAYPRS